MISRDLAKLEKQGIIFLVAGITVWALLSGEINPELYFVPFAIFLVFAAATIFLEREN